MSRDAPYFWDFTPTGRWVGVYQHRGKARPPLLLRRFKCGRIKEPGADNIAMAAAQAYIKELIHDTPQERKATLTSAY